jgi:predicted  nucleic acid-binding Zn-ribbon protein
MDEASLDDLRTELARLEAEEALISAKRRHLHQQIDFGFASEETRALEREISDERRHLHKRIDALRELLGMHEVGSLGPANSDLPLEPR